MADVSYNGACDDAYPVATLAELRKRLAIRLGMGAQANHLPPGVAPLLNDFLTQAQDMLYRRYAVFRTERFFTWDLEPGVRFYGLGANSDDCVHGLDPRGVTWVGVSQGDDQWQPIGCGIDPAWYASHRTGRPERYEIRQAIEVWPAPTDEGWQLRVKGRFGLQPFIEDHHNTTIDPEAVFLLALANAKADRGHPDAGNYVQQLQSYLGDLVAGSHQTRRYLPGARVARNRPMPRVVD